MAFARSPFLQARSAVDMDELSDGRYMLGIGTGNLRNSLGWPVETYPKPVAGLREYVEVVRNFWDAWYYHAGDPIEHRGQYYTVDIPGYYGAVEPPRPDIPVYLAAVLPRMTQLSGEIGDGFVGHPHASVRYFREEVKPNIALGAKRAGRDPASVEVVAMVICAVSQDREEAREMARRQIAWYGRTDAHRAIQERDGFGEQFKAIQEAAVRGDIEGMVNAVSDDILDAYSVSGTPEECRREIARYEGLVDLALLHGPTPGFDAEQIVRNNRNILETFADY